MRIVCQRCAAAYAIEDRLIGPKGVRAQCPRCRNLQLVHREAEPPHEEVTKTATVPGPPSEPRLRCLTCGAELEDPFDRALGVCESCRRR
ncbi:MAG TPA: zinc-ribbon domain-containing protein, partial [Myxococcaceae bacterium]|nr:zinc-ribbon domain-containing protein [Myxococcaceae bacterium]